MTTYRERRERKAERLSEWADKRNAKADAGFSRGEEYRGDTAFWTQPGRIPERDRVFAAHERAMKDRQKADTMQERASGIQAQLNRSIYSDDEDAIERLEERIAELEAQRDRAKAINKEIRKGGTWTQRLDPPLTADEVHMIRTWASVGTNGIAVTNITADIRRNQQRLAQLQNAKTHDAPLRCIRARRDGECEHCGEAINAGDWIGKYPDGWRHISDDGTNHWKSCEAA
jgi:hypothetical protein